MTHDADSYRQILRRVGIAWIIFGLLDIGLMIYSISNKMSYSSSFNIFALIAGVLLYRGSVKTAKFCTSAAAFFLAAFGSLLIVMLLSVAFGAVSFPDLSWYVALPILLLALLYWTYAQLRLQPVLQARLDAGLTDRPPVGVFVFGLMLLPLIGVMMFVMVSRPGPYKDLEDAFRSESVSAAARLVSNTLSLSSANHRGAFSINGGIAVSLSDEYVEIAPEFPFRFALDTVQIPKSEITGCSKTCGGWSSANLLIGSTGTQINIRDSQETLDWCWEKRIPMVSSSDRRDWLYNGVTLPDKSEYKEQLASRDKYDHQAKRSCAGY